MFVIITTVVAALLEPIQFWMTRYYEGHAGCWPEGLRSRKVATWEKLQKCRTENHDKRLKATEDLREATDKQARVKFAREVKRLKNLDHSCALELWQWPQEPARILPTRLGNIVRSYEDRANQLLKESGVAQFLPGRRGIQDLLPFAYFAIPSETRQQHDRFRSQLQAATALMSVIPVVATFIAVAVWHFSGWWTLAAVAGGILLTGSAWAGAKGAGDGYGTMLVAIAEQYRQGLFTVEPETHSSDNSTVAAAS